MVGHGRSGLLERVSGIVEKIHSTATDDSAWQEVYHDIASLFDSMGVTIWTENRFGNILDVRGTPQTDEVQRDYTDYFYKTDFLRPAVKLAPVGTALSSLMLTSRQDLLKTDFYNGFIRHHRLADAVQAKVYANPELSGYIAVTRQQGQGDFEADDVTLLRLLLPHLAGAQRTREHLGFAAVERAGLLATLDGLTVAVLVVGAENHVLHANAAAERLVRMSDGLGTVGGRLCAMRSTDEAALRRAVGEAGVTGGATLAINRPSGRSPLAVTVQPVGPTGSTFGQTHVTRTPVAIVFVIEADGRGAAGSAGRALRALYGLTEAEVEVAQRLAAMQDTKEAADALGIAPTTLRWHLQRIFEKTGMSRQSELARLVERLGVVADAGRPETTFRSRRSRMKRLIQGSGSQKEPPHAPP